MYPANERIHSKCKMLLQVTTYCALSVALCCSRDSPYVICRTMSVDVNMCFNADMSTAQAIGIDLGSQVLFSNFKRREEQSP